MSLEFASAAPLTHTPQDRIDEICVDPGFGTHFTDHMAVATWTQERGWHDDAVVPYAPMSFDPASAVFHYAQEIFEGLKAYRHADGSVWLFRPDANGRRMADSARRLALPELEVDDFITSVESLVRADERWVPGGHEQSLYLRPFTIANENFLGVRAAHTATYAVIASPVGAYFSGGVARVSIWVSPDASRAGAGGTGAAKCGGNYASSLQATREAQANGCSQVLFLDAADHSSIDELGGMNFFIVTRDGELATPSLTGNILPGITRDSILQLAPELGLRGVERRISLDEVLTGIADGSITEAFACGTAAVVTPIGSLKVGDVEHRFDEVPEPTALDIRNHLLDIQYGRVADTRGWMRRVC